MITCPNCGEITTDHVQVTNADLRKQNVNISPIAPACRLCGSAVAIPHTCRTGRIVVISGTCGSGKTTVAEILQEKGYLTIDGDCAIQSLRARTGSKKYEWHELIDEIIHEIDILSLFGEDMVLAHVILPADIPKYLEAFESRNMAFKFVLLKPEYQSAVERCRRRTCHNSITPEEWIRHFYDELAYDGNHVTTIDNTNLTPHETAEAILRLPYSGNTDGR